jgi:anti-anti-sigma factor
LNVTSIRLAEWSRVGDVAVVRILSRELQGPDAAQAFGDQLTALFQMGEPRILIDFARTRVVSSTVFATLLNFWKLVYTANGQLKICSMEPAVRFGADILRLGRYIPIHDDRQSALAAFGQQRDGDEA